MPATDDGISARNEDVAHAMDLSWDELVDLEPRLADLKAEVKAMTGGDRFCANQVWYGYGKRDGLKPRLATLVGHHRARGPKALRGRDAYDVAYDHLYDLLPDCGIACACQQMTRALDEPLPPGPSLTEQRELERERIRQRVREQVRLERIVERLDLPDGTYTLAEELEREEDPLPFTIDAFHPTGSNSLLIAEFKTGQSTLALNLMKSLTDGEPFLGLYDVDFDSGRVAYWNYEVTGQQWRHWARDLQISNPERGAVEHLRDHVVLRKVDLTDGLNSYNS